MLLESYLWCVNTVIDQFLFTSTSNWQALNNRNRVSCIRMVTFISLDVFTIKPEWFSTSTDLEFYLIQFTFILNWLIAKYCNETILMWYCDTLDLQCIGSWNSLQTTDFSCYQSVLGGTNKDSNQMGYNIISIQKFVFLIKKLNSWIYNHSIWGNWGKNFKLPSP